MSTELVVPLSTGDIDRLAEYWWTCWIGMHWGFRRHAAIYWCCTGRISPVKAFHVLNVRTLAPLDIVIFYRELVATQVPEHDLAMRILDMTPEPERRSILRFYAGKGVFETGSGMGRSIARLFDEALGERLPRLRMTDDSGSRVADSRYVFDGLRRTFVMRGASPPREISKTPLIFIGAGCPELIDTLPSLEADLKNQEDVRSIGTMQDDIWEAAKNCFREYPSVSRGEPHHIVRQRAIDAASTPTGKRLAMLQFDYDHKHQSKRVKRR